MKKMEKLIVLIAFIVALTIVGSGQITVPNTFVGSVPVSQLNTNFSTIGDGALKRNGGTITGNITVNSGVTIDGVDIGAVLGASSASTGVFQQITTSNTGATSIDIAGGITAGTGNVGIVGTDGRIPAISSTYFSSLSGANITAIPVSALTNTWTSVSYNAADFSGLGGQTWGVDSGDVITYKYIVIGKMMTVSFYISTTDVGGVANPALTLKIPGGFTAASNMRSSSLWYNDAPTEGAGLIAIPSGSTVIQLYKSNSGGNWTATTSDNTQCVGVITFEIQ